MRRQGEGGTGPRESPDSQQMHGSTESITRLLDRARRGEESARAEILQLTYDELRGMARGFMAAERPGHTLQATALVHEVQMRLLGGDVLPGANRRQFLNYAARAMRHLLVDHARARQREKRAGGKRRPLEDQFLGLTEPGVDILEIDEALERLASLDERKCRVVELKFFAGLEGDRIAEVLEVSPATVDRDWRIARRWLWVELAG